MNKRIYCLELTTKLNKSITDDVYFYNSLCSKYLLVLCYGYVFQYYRFRLNVKHFTICTTELF